MPWKYVGSDESGYRRVFVDERGFIHEDATETTISSNDSWGDYETPATVDSRNVILEHGSSKK